MALDAGAGDHDTRSMRLGDAIRAALGERSQQWLADQLEMDNGNVSRLVNGRVKNVAVEQILRIEEILELRRGHLLRAAGYVDTDLSVRDALASDPDLNPQWQSTIVNIYDAWVVLSAQERASAAGSKRARIPTSKPRR